MIERLAALEADLGSSELGTLNEQHLMLSAEAHKQLQLGLENWRAARGTHRLWDADATLWTGGDEADWLGWLSLVPDFFAAQQEAPLSAIAHEVNDWLVDPEAASEELDQDPTNASTSSAVVLLGMGGSSLGPEVLAKTLPLRRRLFVLDTTDASQIARVENEIDLARSLFVVSSKSGSTLETSLLFDYFYGRVVACVGEEQAGQHFVAVTDRGSKLAALAEERNLRARFWGKESVGGRFSVLSNFGLVPAALSGMDPVRLMSATLPMVSACTREQAQENPGVVLGIALAQAALRGRDKVTLIGSESLAAFGAWADQLLAESTGKNGKGLIPIDLESPLPASRYGTDRVFVSLELAAQQTDPVTDEAAEQERIELDSRVQDLMAAGHPVIRIAVHHPHGIAQEFFRWQVATAVAGSLLGVHPFDQPDVEGSKIESRRLTDAFEETGALPAEEPFVEGTTSLLFADPRNRKLLLTPGDATVAETLTAHLGRVEPGDFFAILAYMDRSDELTELLQSMRCKVAEHFGVATCLGFGPRFLHSAGQAYKGGPNSGVFIQITHEETADLDIPGRDFSFGIAKAAQSRGDFEVMASRERRLLRIHYKGKLVAGLQRLDGLLGRSLESLRSES